MLIQSPGRGFGRGFGYETMATGTLTPLEDYKCNASICYAVGKENHALFMQLQQTINMLSGAAGFAPLVVDGFIGSSTVAALRSLAKIGFTGAFPTKEDVARNALAITDHVKALVASRQAAGQKLSPAQLPATAALPQAKSKKTLWLIAGGLAAVLAVGVGGYVVYRRKARG